jgi:hypothetical protein
MESSIFGQEKIMAAANMETEIVFPKRLQFEMQVMNLHDS